jgi:hypothetical protein
MIDPNQKVLGDIVVFNVKGIKGVPFAQVCAALADNGLDPEAAKQVLPRNAFARAAKKMEKSKVIAKLKDEKDFLHFQFTREQKTDAGGKPIFVYDYETVLVLNKSSGVVRCDEAGNDQLVADAQKLVNEAIGTRDGSQLSLIAQRLFNDHADLFPLRDSGGVYFVPAKFKGFESQVARFLAAVGATMRQVPVPMGTVEGNGAVKDSVTAGLQALVEEHEAAIKGFTNSTRDSTLERQARKISETRFKIEAYAEYLDQVVRNNLLAAVESGRQKLRAKADEIKNAREDDDDEDEHQPVLAASASSDDLFPTFEAPAED